MAGITQNTGGRRRWRPGISPTRRAATTRPPGRYRWPLITLLIGFVVVVSLGVTQAPTAGKRTLMKLLLGLTRPTARSACHSYKTATRPTSANRAARSRASIAGVLRRHAAR